MDHLPSIVAAIWVAGLFVLLMWWGTDMRLALNNFAPGDRTSDYDWIGFFAFRFLAGAVKQEKLTELGRTYRRKAIRTE